MFLSANITAPYVLTKIEAFMLNFVFSVVETLALQIDLTEIDLYQDYYLHLQQNGLDSL